MNNKTYKTVKIVSLKMVRENTIKYNSITEPSDVYAICDKVLMDSAIERFVVIGVDINLTPVVVHIQEGNVFSSSMYASTIFKILLLSNAVNFFIAHSHPGGSATFSEADVRSTISLKASGKLLEIGLLDHILYAGDKNISMKSTSLVEFC
jgi:DNA repair protein RadC